MGMSYVVLCVNVLGNRGKKPYHGMYDTSSRTFRVDVLVPWFGVVAAVFFFLWLIFIVNHCFCYVFRVYLMMFKTVFAHADSKLLFLHHSFFCCSAVVFVYGIILRFGYFTTFALRWELEGILQHPLIYNFFIFKQIVNILIEAEQLTSGLKAFVTT